MHTFNRIDEFRSEATDALFTTNQAMEVAKKLFEAQMADPSTTPEDQAILAKARERVALRYFDLNATPTDAILDAAGVARLTAEEVANAVDAMLFEASQL